MKTPRELLFERHQSAEPALDAIRRKALADLQRDSTPENLEAAASGPTWVGWLLSLRWHLAGMSAIWIVAAVLNGTTSADESQVARRVGPPEAQLLAALRENRRRIAELLEVLPSGVSDPATVAPARVPHRRSEGRSAISLA